MIAGRAIFVIGKMGDFASGQNGKTGVGRLISEPVGEYASAWGRQYYLSFGQTLLKFPWARASATVMGNSESRCLACTMASPKLS